MALDFPTSPGVGQVVTIGGVTWTWDGVKWTAAGTGTGIYLPLTGGTMTGDLILNRDPVVALGAATKQSVDARGAGDNRIINGDMRIDQRNNGASGTAGGYVIDRWACNGSPAGKLTMGRNLVGATGPAGYPYCFGFQSNSAYASAAGDFFFAYQVIEADMVSDFAWGSASAQPVTLSFWAYSSAAGSFSGSIRNSTGARSYPFTFALVSNTWTKVVITIPGDTGGTWVMSGNGGGVILSFDLGSGSSNRGPANTWASAGYLGVTGAVSLVATNAAQLFLTGVKLELGSVATPFNRQSLAKSMADCQRYYQQLGGSQNADFLLQGYAGAGTNAISFTTAIPAMRAAPTVSAVGAWYLQNVSAVSYYTSKTTMAFQATPAASGQVAAYTLDATCYLTLSAEL